MTHYFSAFLGEYEPIGSDVFLQRQFGIENISSRFLESWQGLNGASIYPFYGLGASYVAHVNQNIVAGAYIFRRAESSNSESNSSEDNESNKSLEGMLRVGIVLPNFVMDIGGSIGFSYSNKYGSGESATKVILLIDKLIVNAGMNMLVNIGNDGAVFMQLGFAELELDPSTTQTELDFDKFYF